MKTYILLIAALVMGCSARDTGGDTDADTDININTDTYTDSATDTNTNADTNTDVDSDTNTNSDTDTDTNTDTTIITDAGIDTETGGDTDVDTDTNTSSDSDGDIDTDTDTDTDADTDTDSDTDSDTDTDVDTDTDTDADTDTDTDSNSDTNTDTDSNSGSDTDTNTDQPCIDDEVEIFGYCWLRCPLGATWNGKGCDNINGPETSMTYSEAFDACLSAGSQMPFVHFLMGLFEGCKLTGEIFPNYSCLPCDPGTSCYKSFGTATPYLETWTKGGETTTSTAYVASFASGNIILRSVDYTYPVICVRAP